MEPEEPVLCTGDVQGIGQGIWYLTWKTGSSSGHLYSRKINSEEEGRDLFKLKELVGKRTNWDESDH